MASLTTRGPREMFLEATVVAVVDRGLGLLGCEEATSPVVAETGSVVRLGLLNTP